LFNPPFSKPIVCRSLSGDVDKTPSAPFMLGFIVRQFSSRICFLYRIYFLRELPPSNPNVGKQNVTLLRPPFFLPGFLQPFPRVFPTGIFSGALFGPMFRVLDLFLSPPLYTSLLFFTNNPGAGYERVVPFPQFPSTVEQHLFTGTPLLFTDPSCCNPVASSFPPWSELGVHSPGLSPVAPLIPFIRASTHPCRWPSSHSGYAAPQS